MANVRRLLQEQGKPYLIFTNPAAEKLAPDLFSGEDSSKEPQTTVLPSDWSPKTFAYIPLAGLEHNLRLLHLHPGEHDDPIICSIKVKGFYNDRWPAYNALSYQWGEPTPTQPINVLNGGVLNVRSNLYDALVQLRSRYEDKIFWIDAVCINQEDLVEKSHQIRLMGKIYSRATNVITWLGKASEDSDAAMEYLAQYAALMGYPNPNSKIPPPSDEQVVALNRLFERGYWNRAWIIQEIASCGPRGYIFCGSKWIYWECVDWFRIEQERGRQDTIDGRMGVNAVNEQVYSILSSSKYRELTRDGAAYSNLIDLLRLARQRDATFPVDKIYGILGLTGDHIQEKIVPDYTKLVRDVILHTTRTALEEMLPGDQMSLLCDAAHSRSDLPSWCPDWTELGVQNGFRYDAYSASARSAPKFKLHDEILELTVVIADRIFDSSDQVFDGNNWDAIDEMELIAENVITIMSRGEEGPTPVKQQSEEQKTLRQLGLMLSGEERFKESFYRTLCADVDSNGERGRASLEYGKFLEQYRKAARSANVSRCDSRSELFSRLLCEAFSAMIGRRFFVIEKKFMGIGPAELRPGDYIVVVLGAKMPFVIRHEAD
ncbi:heterokaryon incompatibility protein-domain-containing protein [Pyrenochaeta sp. MPI-SDFR-AT-0127]|nr:heterokaryon incompatibility protein-domain-containing protein [Pyrenochaeta sp. MPI-SDFR-AT-0127]